MKGANGCLQIEPVADQKTPLHLSIIVENPRIGRLLLMNGGDVQRPMAEDDGGVVTPVQYTARNSQEEMLKVMTSKVL